MNWFTRYVLGSVSPRWALRREHASRALRNYYEGGEPSQQRKKRSTGSGDAAVQRAGTRLRDTARYLEENYDVASGALDVLVNNTVGSGIVPEPLVQMKNGEPAQDVNDALLRLWDEWTHACEVTGQHDYYSMQRLIARSYFRDGEAFCRKIIGSAPGLTHGTDLPYSIEAFEADFVPLDYEDAAKRVRQGIALDAWGKPTRYYLHSQHPGDTRGLITLGDKLRSIDAASVMHVKMVRRLHQLRGTSIFGTVLNRFDDLKEIDENERVAARVAAAMSAFIKKGLPDFYEKPETDEGGEPKRREISFEPGMVFDDLLPGEEIGTIASNRPNNALIPFRDAQLRSASAGLMVSNSSLSKNYDGTYSAQRQELVEQFVMYRALSGSLVFRLCQPVWDGFVDASVLSGKIALAGVDLATLFNVSHICPPMPWIDPKKELEAFVLAEENLYESKSSIIRKRSGVPNQVYREIKRDRQQLDALGLEERSQAAKQQQGQPDDDDDDDEPKPQPGARAVFRAVQRKR